ncbi:probable thimet oligopeptidase isoform X4 [Magnolia sinica]|uniref:probable thimet oligopeptidase isoform X4 n=1 Tax=Magnolia sinica TaxID=86752 RepID=UPI00265B3298|nr:probable thimet oligopeptidase isoform X4 [Magnolia sinica]
MSHRQRHPTIKSNAIFRCPSTHIFPPFLAFGAFGLRRNKRMGKEEEGKKKGRRMLALTGAAALVAVAINLLFTALNAHKSKNQNKKKPKAGVLGLTVHVNLSASEILKLADRVIAKSKDVHDYVASIPLDKVTYTNVILTLAELEAQQFPLVQSCVFQKMVGLSDDVRKASAEAERRIDAHLLICSKREDVYRVIKAFAAKGEWMNAENKHYVNCLVRDFERNGMNLTLSKREEVERLRTQIDELSMRYIQNLNEDNTTIIFSESELAGLPREFIKGLDKAENGKVKVTLRSHHITPILEHCKVGSTRKTVAVAQGQRCGEVNLSILENLVQLRHKLARLLGYSNYADYVVEPRMARTSAKIPVALITSQLPKQIDGNPGLMRFSEVVNLFHEFSHVVHHICNCASFARFSGLRVEADFVEIPGKLLENWCYESIPLKMMSGFHQDITKPVTDEMCRLLKRRRDSFSGLKLKQEILLCYFDEIIHSSENVDMVELLKHLHPKIMLGIPLLEGSNPASCFSRLAIGYEAACYSHIWSEVFAADIFASKFQDDLLNQYVGLQFKKKVLAPGGSKDPMEILFDFLGRKPSVQAYVEHKTRNSI